MQQAKLVLWEVLYYNFSWTDCNKDLLEYDYIGDNRKMCVFYSFREACGSTGIQ